MVTFCWFMIIGRCGHMCVCVFKDFLFVAYMNEWKQLDMCEHACMCTQLYCPVKSIHGESMEGRK